MSRISLKDDKKAERRKIRRDPAVTGFFSKPQAERHQWIDDNIRSATDAAAFMKVITDYVIANSGDS